MGWIVFVIFYILIVFVFIALCRAGSDAGLEGSVCMTKNYFAIEREGKHADHIFIKRNGELVFTDTINMSYDEIKVYERIDELVVAIMDAANEYFEGTNDTDTVFTLLGEDDLFIWSIIIGPGDNDDEFKYEFVDWRKDGKNYRYKKD